MERQLRREMEFNASAIGRRTWQVMQAHDSFAARQMNRELENFNSLGESAVQQHIRRMNDSIYQSTLASAHIFGPTLHERRLWYYRKVANLITFQEIRKAVNKLLETLFPRFDRESFFRRQRAALIKQVECNGVVKAHSPPVRLIPKTLHPIDSVA